MTLNQFRSLVLPVKPTSWVHCFASFCRDKLCFTCFFCACVCVQETVERVFIFYLPFCDFFGVILRVWLRLTPVSSCVSCVGLLVQDLTDTILSSYAYKSHYLLTESNRAELKLPMIPSPSSATKKNVGKGNCTVFLFLLCPTGLCLWCACSSSDLVYPFCTHLSFQSLEVQDELTGSS